MRIRARPVQVLFLCKKPDKKGDTEPTTQEPDSNDCTYEDSDEAEVVEQQKGAPWMNI